MNINLRTHLTIQRMLNLSPLLSALIATTILSAKIQSSPLELLVIITWLITPPLTVWLAKTGSQIARTPLGQSLVGLTSVAVVLGVTFFPILGLNTTSIQFLICSVPLVWSAYFSLYFLLSPQETARLSKLLASLAATFVGMSVIFIVWYMGAQPWVLKHPAPGRFPYTFSIWENLPIKKHLFLTFDQTSNYENGLCYHGYSHLYSISHWLPLRIVRWHTGFRYDVLIRLSVFAHAAVCAFLLPTCLAYRSFLDETQRPRFLAMLVIPTALILSIPDLWTGPLFFDADNSFVLFALLVFINTSLLAKLSETPTRSLTVTTFCSLTFFGLFIPVAAILYGVVLVVYGCSRNGAPYLKGGILLMATSVAMYGGTVLLAPLAGLTANGGSFMHRSGLILGGGGSLSTAWQALSRPITQDTLRSLSSIWLGIFAAVAAILISIFQHKSAPSMRLVFLLIAPLLLDLSVFSQSHSIHPYLYDIPIALLGMLSLVWVLQSTQENSHEMIESITPWALVFMLCAIFGNFMALRSFFLRIAV